MTIREAIEKVVNLEDLGEEEMTEVMESIMTGEATASQIAAFITALRIKGETIDEIVAAAKVMRGRAIRLNIPDSYSNGKPVIDIVGTGGDKSMTFNISTTTAFVVAAGGVKVAKHGNRSVSSRCGSADVLEALGINIEATPEAVQTHIEKAGIGFLFAPTFHRSMRHALTPRKEIGIRTVFNILGPLTNPAFTRHILAGVYKDDLCKIFPHALKRLGAEKAMVVHGVDGLDEISICGETSVGELSGENITFYSIKPEDFGLNRYSLEALKGGDGETNAKILKDILSGKEYGAKRDIVLLNAGVGFYVADVCATIKEGIEYATHIIDSSLALKKLKDFIEVAKR
ncbi:MAG: anthranilate phosphoribosyltransferase [Syntrophorhabdaceae bacterium]|nr:anthranilate phosphoribosyltransferase [Syntrophorhabdaceae bacterium]